MKYNQNPEQNHASHLQTIQQDKTKTKAIRTNKSRRRKSLFSRQNPPHPLNFLLLLARPNLRPSPKLLRNNTNQPHIILSVLEKPLRGSSPGVNATPLVPDPIGLVAPCAKADLFDDGGCHDLLTAEDTPCDRVDVIGVHLDDVVVVGAGGVSGEGGLEITLGVCGEPGEFLVAVLFQDGFEAVLEVLVWTEELDEWLLEDEALVLWTPAEDWVVAAHAVDGGLRGECPPAAAVDEFE